MSSIHDSLDPPGPIVQWAEQAVFIKDLVENYPVPNLVKIIKGQYRNIGVSKSVHTELYLHAVKTTTKVLAEAVKIKDSSKHRIAVSDQKYSLPVSYQGWFELLSEDGRAIRAIQNIQELARFFPQTCLVRENIKAYLYEEGSDVSSDKVKLIQAGDRLTLVGEVSLQFHAGKSGSGKRKFLRCIDSKGENVFFLFEQRGLFSPIAGQTNISGVHTLKGLLDKFRLPIMVRLVHGVIPTKMEKNFSGAFRLVSVYSDETAFLCPLKPEAKMVPISTKEPLKLVTCANFDVMQGTETVQLHQKRCEEMFSSYMNSIHILIAMPDPTTLAKGKDDHVKTQEMRKSQSATTLHSTDSRPVLNAPNSAMQPIKGTDPDEDLLFQEVDDIYHYVREGGLPPTTRGRQSFPSTNGIILPPPANGVTYSVDELEDDDPSKETKQQQMDLPEEDTFDTDTITRDNNYWEDPIYEPLEKIREMKRKSDGKRHISDTMTPMRFGRMLEQSNGASTNLSGSGGEGSPVSSKGGDLDKLPVANLRQLLKPVGTKPAGPSRSKSLDAALHASEIEKVYDSVPPPVPPKLYDEKDVIQMGKNTPARRSGKFIANGNAKSQTVAVKEEIRSPARPVTATGFDEITSATVAALEGSRGHKRRPALVKQPGNREYSSPAAGLQKPATTASSHNHPPYVAVAQVGNYSHSQQPVKNNQHQKYSNGSTKPAKTGTPFENMKRRLQSLHL